MQIKKLLALFLALALAVGLAGCGVETENGELLPDTPPETPSGAVISETEGGVISDSGVGETISEKEFPFEPEFEIMSWTMKDFVTNMEIAGETISLPCTVSEFEKIFKIEYFSYWDSDDTTYCILSLNGKLFCSVWVPSKIESKSNLRKSNLYVVNLSREDDLFVNFNIMGITNESNKEEILSILGMPNTSLDENTIKYSFSKNEIVMFVINKEGLIESLMIIYNLKH